MREFIFEDGFTLSAALDKMGISDDVSKLISDATKAENLTPEKQEEIGGKLMILIIRKMHLAKNEILGFVAGITEESIEEVKKFNLAKLKTVLTGIFQNPEFADFFK